MFLYSFIFLSNALCEKTVYRGFSTSVVPYTEALYVNQNFELLKFSYKIFFHSGVTKYVQLQI